MRLFDALTSFLQYHYEKKMQNLGFRKMWYYPSRHYLNLCDFWTWEYRPNLEPGEYNTEQCPPKKIIC